MRCIWQLLFQKFPFDFITFGSHQKQKFFVSGSRLDAEIDVLSDLRFPCRTVLLSRYNDIYRVQMPNITPHVCRHTYCSNMAKSGMNPKTLQYLMGHSDISVTMNVYTHIGFNDAEEELKRMEEFRKAQAEVEQKKKKPMSQKMFKVI